MSSYQPPTATYPIFDSLAFQTPNSGSLTIADADVRYLSRQNVATSNATSTTFNGDITIKKPITLGYTVQPVAGQIGYTVTLGGTGANVNPMIAGVFYNTRTLGFPSLPIGTYILKVYVSFDCVTGGLIDYLNIGLSSTTPTYTNVGAQAEIIMFGVSAVAGQRVIGSSTYVFYNSSVRTLYGTYDISFSTGVYSTNTSTCYLQYTRIA